MTIELFPAVLLSSFMGAASLQPVRGAIVEATAGRVNTNLAPSLHSQSRTTLRATFHVNKVIAGDINNNKIYLDTESAPVSGSEWIILVRIDGGHLSVSDIVPKSSGLCINEELADEVGLLLDLQRLEKERSCIGE